MIKSIVFIIYNVIRIGIYKLLYNKRFTCSPIQRINPFCSLKLYKKGKMIIGKNCEFEHGCDFQVHDNATLKIGDRTYFNRYCMISAHLHIEIGEGCMFGPGVKIFDNNHRFSKKDGVSPQLKCDEIFIGKNCWIASNAILLKGTHIGDNCVIGAGCIVSGHILPGTIVKCKQELEYSDIK